MSFLNSLNITGSALTAERYRMDVILQNLAAMSVTDAGDGQPYRRQQVVFQERELSFSNVLKGKQEALEGGGVHIKEVVESDKPFTPVFDPSHPQADENGYVLYPNVSHSEEQIDLMAATRAYEANLAALNVVKAMASKALEIGR